MDSETKKQVLKIYKDVIEKKIEEVKKEIKEELKKMDEKESFLTGTSESGDVGGICSSHNLTNSLIAMKNAKLDYMNSCLDIIGFDPAEPDNIVKVLSIVKVKYSAENDSFTKIFFIVPCIPGKSEIYKDNECEICALSLDTPLAHSLIGATKNSWVTSTFKGVEYDGLVEEVL